MKNRLRYFILLLCLLGTLSLNAQTVSPHVDSIGQKIASSLSDYYKRYPQEKTFIHTDENVYVSGQAVWYKAYAMAFGKPSQLSKILYVRLSDAKGKLIKQDKLPLKNGAAYGNFNLPDSLHTGWYQLQAFTAWMLNFDEDDFYKQKIFIQNVRDKDAYTTPVRAQNGYHINFFPEGGDLVDGNISNIAFKATDENGLPIKVYGEVLDKSKKTINKLVTIHDGMGSFELEAYANENYTARVHYPDSSIQNVTLPEVKKTGISLRVNTAQDNELELKMAYADQKQAYQDVIIEAVQNNGTSVTYPLQLSRGLNIFSLKKNDFSTGILRLTIFDATGLPVAERIVFVNNNDQFKFSLNADTLSHYTKSKNSFTLNLKDNNGQPVKANLSVSVTDAGIGNEPGDNICSYFLMTSELRAYIHRPAYYFQNNSDSLQNQLDLVMLTNGWRHFRWDSILNTKPRILKHAVEQSQFIAGKIENYRDKPNLKIKLMITNEDSGKYIGFVEPDSTGSFILKDYNHKGAANLYYSAVNGKNKKQPVKITFLKTGIDTITFTKDTINSFALSKPAINKPFLDSVARGLNSTFIVNSVALKTVTIKERELSPTEILINSHVQRLSTNNAYTLDLVNSSLPSMSLIDYIIGKFPGLQIYQSADGSSPVFEYRGTSTLLRKKDSIGGEPPDQPYYYVDESQATLNDIKNISLVDVALIRFVPPPVWFAPLNGGNNGAILVYTKRYGDEKFKNNREDFDQYTFNGYSVTREFSSPNYSITKASAPPDYRTTLYWNPDLKIDNQGGIKIRFYNSDKAKKYRVIIQGMDAGGRVGYLSEEF